MQVLKDDIKQRIINVARQEFLRHGFSKASMRVIAAKTGVRVGNLYHYYPGKDDLFRAVVAPVITACYTMLHKHRYISGAWLLSALISDYLTAFLSDYTAILSENRALLKILIFKAQGSSLENFKAEFTNCAALQLKAWFADNSLYCQKADKDAVDFLTHLHTVWMFHMFEEFLMRDIDGKQMQRIVAEHIRFETAGWKTVLQCI